MNRYIGLSDSGMGGLTILNQIMVSLPEENTIYFGDMGITGMIFEDRIYPYLTLEDTINLTITALVITLLASLYPARLAARMEPVEALHGKN